MDMVYAALITLDYPDAVTRGLRRTTDQFRAVLERTHSDLPLPHASSPGRASASDGQRAGVGATLDSPELVEGWLPGSAAQR